jgi:hypothetical protein
MADGSSLAAGVLGDAFEGYARCWQMAFNGSSG